MAISVTKPSVNLREKLNELDFDRVPFQKMPAGSVLQVVTAEETGALSTTSTTFAIADTVTITPKSTNSKILVVFNTNGHLNTSQRSGDECEATYSIFRNSVNLGDSDYGICWTRLRDYTGNSIYSEYPLSIQVVDTPETLEAITYTSRFRSRDAGVSVGYAYSVAVRTIVLMEIAQ